MLSKEWPINSFSDLSKNTKRGLKAKAERGWYPAQPPLGYLHNPLKRKGEKEMMKDPARFEMTRKIFDWMLSGTYLPSQVIEKAAKELGLTNRFNRSVGRATIYQILEIHFIMDIMIILRIVVIG